MLYSILESCSELIVTSFYKYLQPYTISLQSSTVKKSQLFRSNQDYLAFLSNFCISALIQVQDRVQITHDLLQFHTTIHNPLQVFRKWSFWPLTNQVDGLLR